MNKQHGSIVWGIRMQELHPAMAAKHDAWAPLGVVQGPTEPRSMDGILSSAVDFFARHDPGVQLAVGTVASAA